MKIIIFFFRSFKKYFNFVKSIKRKIILTKKKQQKALKLMIIDLLNTLFNDKNAFFRYFGYKYN